MDCKTGEIHRFCDTEKLEKWQELNQRLLVPLSEDDANALEELGYGKRKNNMRNRECVCGSGRKFKKCCWGKYA